MFKTRQRDTSTTIVAIGTPPLRVLLVSGLAVAALWSVLAYPLLSRSLAGFELAAFWRHDDEPAAAAVALESGSEGAVYGERDRETVLELIRNYRHVAEEPWRRQLADAIYEESVAESIDPLMVASIVARESSFRSRVVSRAGAVGLMQLRPFVAREVARRSAIEWNGVETLHAPQHNVRLGILYYKELLDRFEGDPEMALTAYLYGPTRVRRQIALGTYNGSAYADGILDLYSTLSTRRAG